MNAAGLELPGLRRAIAAGMAGVIAWVPLLLAAEEWPNAILDREPDLTVPAMTEGDPAAGKRVKQQLPEYAGSDLFHALYLPTNWQAGRRHAVIFEYPGNGPFQNKWGDTNSGRVEDCNLGYGIAGGQDCIWVCLPFVEPKTKTHALQWWGDPEATAAYCRAAVKKICGEFGGDPRRLVLCGFSRGAIACNYIGLRDDETAQLWRCMVAHSHYDGVHRWPYADSDRESALARLNRLGDRPQFLSHESSITETARFLEAASRKPADSRFTLVGLPFPNHTDRWVLRDSSERRQLRAWLGKSLGSTTPEPRE